MIFAVAAGALFGLLAAAGGLLWIFTRAPKNRSTGDLSVHELDDGVYMYRGHFSNSAFFVMNAGVVVVDTQVSPAAAKRLRQMIESVTDKPVLYVINTHYHGDHTGGNALFPEAEIIATEQTAQYVVERDGERLEYAHHFGLEYQEVHDTVGPTRTFSGSLTVEVGDEQLEVLQVGRCETPDACIVVWRERGVVACGDGVATWDYPYLGVPFMDEGLRDDGEWVGFLQAIRDIEPEILIAGHGPAIVGSAAVDARLELLISLFTDLLDAVRRELKAKTPLEQLVARVDAELSHYTRRRDLAEQVTGQRFAIYRCVNNMIPERAGKGWWDDLRPSVVERAEPARVEAELAELESTAAVCARARQLVGIRDRALALSLLEGWIERCPEDDPRALGELADVAFDGAIGIVPKVDGTEFLVIANDAAKRALAINRNQPLALLNLGMSQILGAMVLAQSMDAGIAKIERALEADLTAMQRRKGAFFLGKAYQYKFMDDEADRWFRRAVPRWARVAFPLIRERMRCTP